MMHNREYSTISDISLIVGVGVISIVAGTSLSSYASTDRFSENITHTEIDFLVDKVYSLPRPTWSDVTTSVEFSQSDNIDEISIGLNIINKLAFIEGDSEVEKAADNFFDSVNFTTRKIIIK